MTSDLVHVFHRLDMPPGWRSVDLAISMSRVRLASCRTGVQVHATGEWLSARHTTPNLMAWACHHSVSNIGLGCSTLRCTCCLLLFLLEVSPRQVEDNTAESSFHLAICCCEFLSTESLKGHCQTFEGRPLLPVKEFR